MHHFYILLYLNEYLLDSFLGASAASAALRNSGGGGESPEGEELDQGDGINNELVLRYYNPLK